MMLEALELVEGRQPRVWVVQPDHEADDTRLSPSMYSHDPP
jgi:hypothetical protein